MSHYKDQYESDLENQKIQRLKMFYNNKLNGLSLLAEMMEIELDEKVPDEDKLRGLMIQITKLSEGD